MGNRDKRDGMIAESTGRPVVGEASTDVRRAALAQRLKESEPPPPKTAPPADTAPTENTVLGAARLLKRRGRQIDQAVDDAS